LNRTLFLYEPQKTVFLQNFCLNVENYGNKISSS